MLYGHLLIHAEIYIYMLDTYRRNDDRRKKTSLTKYLPLSLLQEFERVVQGLLVRGSWRPNITEIFWPRSYGRQRCVFLVLHGCSTGALESNLLGAGFPYYISSHSHFNSTELSPSVQFVGLILPSNSDTVIWTRLHASAISSDIWRSGCITSASFGITCVIVIERKKLSCSSEVTLFQYVSLWEYNGIFFTSSHFISQFPPTWFPLITATRMCHFLPVHHLEWHFWPGQKVKT